MHQATRTRLDLHTGLVAAIAAAREQLDHPAHRAAAIQRRDVAAHHLDALDLVEHQVLDADLARGVLA